MKNTLLEGYDMNLVLSFLNIVHTILKDFLCVTFFKKGETSVSRGCEHLNL